MPQYDISDPALLPLFELPGDWFGELTAYETAAGPFAQIAELTPTYTIFRAFQPLGPDASPEAREQHRDLIGLAMVDDTNDVTVVADREEALEQDSRAIWVTTDGRSVTYESEDADEPISLPKHVYVYEYLPFDNPIGTRYDLKEALDPQLDTTPAWDEVFDDAESVGHEMTDDMAADTEDTDSKEA